MAERLLEVSEELAADWLDLLGQQADVVDEGGRPLELASSANLARSTSLGQQDGPHMPSKGKALQKSERWDFGGSTPNRSDS